MGIACHNANDTYNHMPPNTCMFPEAWGGMVAYQAPGGPLATSFFHLLPFLEQDNLYKSTYLPVGPGLQPWWYGWNNGGHAGHVKTFMCPSDPGMSADQIDTRTGWTMTSYAANAQVFSFVDATGQYNGGNFPWSWGSPRIPATFQDGTSNTILFTEKYAQCGGVYENLWNHPWGDPTNGLWRPSVFDSQASPTSLGCPGCVNVAGQSENGVSMFQVQPSPYASPVCDRTLPSTGHTGGIMVCMGDASTRLVTQAVSPTTWWYAATPAGGDILGPDW
jgi:hypothetical protein